jgi:DHA2 family multidrug resistance protein-like MFS transporter
MAQPKTPGPAADGLPLPRRYWAILTVGIAVAMSVLDGAIANIALPTIARDLGATPAAAIWIVNAYQLTITVSLLPFSSLGDHVGYRRVYWAGLLIFTAASLACALSRSLVVLALARTLQGFGAAGITSVNTALIRFIYPARFLGRGVGINSLVVSTAAAAGPTVGAAILSVAPWPWLFSINVPLGLLALLLSLRSLPRTEHAGGRFDWPSAALSAATLGLLISAITGAGHGEAGRLVGVEAGAALLLGFALVRRQTSLPAPMLPVDLFRRPVFALSVAASACAFVAQGLAYVSLPFYFQDVLGRTPVQTGVLMTPWPLAVGVVAPVAGILADRAPAGALGSMGLAGLTAGLVLLALLPAHPATPDIMWRMALCGLGFGFFGPPNNRTIINAVPPARSGNASGMISGARLLGQTTGAAMVALVFGLTARGAAGAGAERICALLGAAFAAGAAALSGLRLVDFRPGRPAGRQAAP